MEDGNNISRVIFHKIKDRIGKPPGQGLPEILVHNRIHFWVALNLMDAAVNCPEKFRAQTWIAFFIPPVRLSGVKLSFVLENDPPDHFRPRICCFTSAQGKPAAGSSA